MQQNFENSSIADHKMFAAVVAQELEEPAVAAVAAELECDQTAVGSSGTRMGRKKLHHSGR